MKLFAFLQREGELFVFLGAIPCGDLTLLIIILLGTVFLNCLKKCMFNLSPK